MNSSTLLRVLLAGALLTGVAACTKHDEPIGPAQKAGAAIDQAGERVAKDLHDKLDKADQAAKQMTQAAKDTGAQISDATADAADDASKKLDQATVNVGKKVEHVGERIQEAGKKP